MAIGRIPGGPLCQAQKLGRQTRLLYYYYYYTQSNVYVFKLTVWLITKLITLDLKLKSVIFCGQSARALSLFLYTSACPRSLPWRQTETVNAVVWVSESALIAGRIKWIVKKKKMPGGADKARLKKRKPLEDDAAKCAKLTNIFQEDKRAHVNWRLMVTYSD